MGNWAGRVHAITLVVEDLDAAREFYGRAFAAARALLQWGLGGVQGRGADGQPVCVVQGRRSWTRFRRPRSPRAYGCN